MEEPQPPLPSMGATPLFQPIPVERDASFTMAAAQVGVDINSDADLQAYLATPLTTRAQVLDTIRHYHVGVIRPEVFNLISQVEQVVAKLDDRSRVSRRGQVDCSWLQQGGTLLCPLNWMLGQLQCLRLLHLLVLGSSSAGAEYTACSLKPSPRHRLEKERAAAKVATPL